MSIWTRTHIICASVTVAPTATVPYVRRRFHNIPRSNIARLRHADNSDNKLASNHREWRQRAAGAVMDKAGVIKVGRPVSINALRGEQPVAGLPPPRRVVALPSRGHRRGSSRGHRRGHRLRSSTEGPARSQPSVYATPISVRASLRPPSDCGPGKPKLRRARRLSRSKPMETGQFRSVPVLTNHGTGAPVRVGAG
jgi:hypothetical protein